MLSFVDTNIYVYALAGDDDSRSPVAQTLLRELMQNRSLRTSTQVLQELYVTLTRKGKKPMTSEAALRYLDQIARWPVESIDFRAIKTAAELSASDMLSFWDALVVVVAARSGAKILYSEDLQHGREIMGLRIINPFKQTAQ